MHLNSVWKQKDFLIDQSMQTDVFMVDGDETLTFLSLCHSLLKQSKTHATFSDGLKSEALESFLLIKEITLFQQNWHIFWDKNLESS